MSQQAVESVDLMQTHGERLHNEEYPFFSSIILNSNWAFLTEGDAWSCVAEDEIPFAWDDFPGSAGDQDPSWDKAGLWGNIWWQLLLF